MSESNMSISEMLTYSTVLINCQYADGSVGSGTGFIVNLCKKQKTQYFQWLNSKGVGILKK